MDEKHALFDDLWTMSSNLDPPQECAPLLYVDEQVTLIILYHSFTYVEFFVCSSRLG